MENIRRLCVRDAVVAGHRSIRFANDGGLVQGDRRCTCSGNSEHDRRICQETQEKHNCKRLEGWGVDVVSDLHL